MKFPIKSLPQEKQKKIKEIIVLWLYEKLKEIFGKEQIEIVYYEEDYRIKKAFEFVYQVRIYDSSSDIFIRHRTIEKVSELFSEDLSFDELVANVEKWLEEKVKKLKEKYENEVNRIEKIFETDLTFQKAYNKWKELKEV